MLTDKNKYQLLVDSVYDYALCLLDGEGTLVSWNRGAERATGYREEEILGTFFGDVFADAALSRQDSIQLLARVREHGCVEAQGWCRQKGGQHYWANVVIDRVLEGDQVIGFVCIARDLTERKIAGDRLRHSEEQFRLLVQGVGDCAICMLDTAGRVTSWNTGAQRIKGYSFEQALGQHLSLFYTREDRANGVPEHALAMAAQTGRYESEGWRLRKDGSSFWANAILDRIEDDDGQHIGFAMITRDITARREAEQELTQAREALLQSQKLESIGQLTGGVAHDFNNLLMAVIGSLELLELKLAGDPSALHLVANALTGAQRGAALTKRMLAFARKQELSPTAVDLEQLVGSIGDLLQRSAGPTIAIETSFPSGLPRVLVDSNQLELALLNLITNARDATRDGGRIAVAAHEEKVELGHPTALAPGDFVCLSVSDRGKGMDAATLRRAMEPFFTTKGVGKGTGLGLSMVHGLAEQSGGRLMLRSEPGHGTLAEIWLPVGTTQANEPAPEHRLPSGDNLASGPCHTILVVDDDPLIAMTMSAVLEDLGHHVVEAHSAQEALGVMERRKDIDLLITDYAMPQVNGLELANRIRTHHPDLPVVLASGYAELPSGSAADVVRLAKPFARAQLQDALTRAVHESQGHGA